MPPPDRTFGATGLLEICFSGVPGALRPAPLKKHYKKVRRRVGAPSIDYFKPVRRKANYLLKSQKTSFIMISRCDRIKSHYQRRKCYENKKDRCRPAFSFAVYVCYGSLHTQDENSSGTASEQSSQAESSAADEQSSKTEDSSSEVTKYTLTIRNAEKSAEMKAVFSNTQTDKTEEVRMTKTGEDDTCYIYTCESDPTAYNMFRISYNGSETRDVTFNTFTEAWYLYERELLPCRKDQDYVEKPDYKTEVLKFHGYDKKVHIWTPEGYDPNADTDYSVIYMLDGQTVIDAELDPGNNRSWSVAQHVTSMMDVTDNKAILVCVETMGSDDRAFSRDDELIPDLDFSEEIKQKADSKFLCKEFGDFLSDTVVPFVEENYKVVRDASHRSICGSSLGGLASFYIGLEHPETFGTLGALSSTFSVADEDTWKNYIMPKIQSGKLPFIFMYDGCYYEDNGALSEIMNNALIENGYPKDKIVFCKYEPGKHEVASWSGIYPQFLEAVFNQKLAAVRSGETVEYKDKSKLHPALDPSLASPEAEIKNDTRPDYIKNYIFYDNSETKWDRVFAYFWGGIPTNKVTGEVFDIKYADWPGYEMEKVEGTDLYRMPVPVGSSNIIFSTGVKDEDVAKGVVAYQTSDLIFSNVNNSGKIYKIDTSVEAKPGSGKAEKTKYRYSAGEWRDYTE